MSGGIGVARPTRAIAPLSGRAMPIDYAPMDRTVAHFNIEHYRKLLTQEMNEIKRQTILRLLAEEEAKLASLNNPLQRKRRSS